MLPFPHPRLERELWRLYADKVLGGNKVGGGSKRAKIRVEDPPRRKHMVGGWLAGCVVSGPWGLKIE